MGDDEQMKTTYTGDVWTLSIFGHRTLKASVQSPSFIACYLKIRVVSFIVSVMYYHPELGVYWGITTKKEETQ